MLSTYTHTQLNTQFSSVTQSCLTLCDPTDSLCITNTQSLLKLMFIELMMSSNHLILCCPLLLLPLIFPSIRVFSNELAFMLPWTAAHLAYLSFTISQSLLKLTSIELVMPSNHLVLCRPLLLCLQSFTASGSFLMSPFFTPGGQSIGASTSVLPMKIQD